MTPNTIELIPSAAFEESPRVTVIITAKNEERTIGGVVDSALKLDYPNFEVLVVDCGSEDQTVAIAGKKPVKIVQIESSTPGRGRNIGIKNSSAGVVALLDGDCYARKDWLKNAVNLLMPSSVGGVGGPKIPYANGKYRSRALLNAMSISYTSAQSTNFVRCRKTKEVENLGGIGVYKKKALEKAGLYSEDLRFCEDVDLNNRLRLAGYSLLYSPDVIVEHDWKVDSFRSLFHTMFRYGCGRAIASKKSRHLFAPLYAVPSLALLLISFLILLSTVYGGLFIFASQFLILLYGVLVLLSTCSATYRFRDARMVAITPITQVVTHFGYATGFIFGLIRRAT